MKNLKFGSVESENIKFMMRHFSYCCFLINVPMARNGDMANICTGPAPHWLGSAVRFSTTQSCGRMSGKKGPQLLIIIFSQKIDVTLRSTLLGEIGRANCFLGNVEKTRGDFCLRSTPARESVPSGHLTGRELVTESQSRSPGTELRSHPYRFAISREPVA